jgi:undecaprenyl diphosphate synthase
MNKLQHLGIIMDGNRRWAKKNMLKTVTEGHKIGARRFIDLCSWCIDENIQYVTVYAFSVENWSRPQEEIDGIFDLIEYFFNNEIENCIKNGVRLRILGDRAKLKQSTQNIVEDAENKTRECAKLNAQIALNYTGRDEIIRSINKLFAKRKEEKSFDKDVTAEEFEKYLDTAGIPDIDLVIRTGADGRKRLSGFFPWQSVYAELNFLDLLWPDFSKKDLVDAIAWYNEIKRLKGA